MENKVVKVITFFLVTFIAIALGVILFYVKGGQPLGYDKYAYIAVGLLAGMIFVTFVMRSIVNSSYIWILGIILMVVVSGMFVSTDGYYVVAAAAYVGCLLFIFVKPSSGGGSDDCNCDCNCDCCVGECY